MILNQRKLLEIILEDNEVSIFKGIMQNLLKKRISFGKKLNEEEETLIENIVTYIIEYDENKDKENTKE